MQILQIMISKQGGNFLSVILNTENGPIENSIISCIIRVNESVGSPIRDLQGS